MKNRPPKILLIITVICLLGIGSIILKGLVSSKNSSKKIIDTNYPEVLGQTIETQLIPAAESGIKDIAKEVWDNSKEDVSEKIDTAKNDIMRSVQKEVTSLTQSQIDALKLQICRELGVLPTTTPAPKP